MAHFLRQIGGLAFILGVFAVVLNFVNMVPRLLMWIYMWGEDVAWMIKIAFIIIGGALWIIGYKLTSKVSQPVDMNPESLK